jgi:hypothetical protein
LYSVVNDEQAQPHVDALPAEALGAFAEVRVLLETAPWSGRPSHECMRRHLRGPFEELRTSIAGA